MLRRPNLPTRDRKKFDLEEFEMEKEWLLRKQQGKIFTSVTPADKKIPIGTASILAFVVGATIGAFLSFVFQSIIFIIVIPTGVFVIVYWWVSSEFANIDIDPENKIILYDGIINFGGEYRTTRYRGSVKIITGTQLMKFKLMLGRRSQPFIRFLTNSGYMRIKFDESESEFLAALEETGLIDLNKMKQKIKENIIMRDTDKYVVFLEDEFDRSEYLNQLKQIKEVKEDQKKIKKKMKRQELIDESKKYIDESDLPEDNPTG